jgi:hypothetical protein
MTCPAGTGTPKEERRSRAWCSWIFMDAVGDEDDRDVLDADDAAQREARDERALVDIAQPEDEAQHDEDVGLPELVLGAELVPHQRGGQARESGDGERVERGPHPLGDLEREQVDGDQRENGRDADPDLLGPLGADERERVEEDRRPGGVDPRAAVSGVEGVGLLVDRDVHGLAQAHRDAGVVEAPEVADGPGFGAHRPRDRGRRDDRGGDEEQDHREHPPGRGRRGPGGGAGEVGFRGGGG